MQTPEEKKTLPRYEREAKSSIHVEFPLGKRLELSQDRIVTCKLQKNMLDEIDDDDLILTL